MFDTLKSHQINTCISKCIYQVYFQKVISKYSVTPNLFSYSRAENFQVIILYEKCMKHLREPGQHNFTQFLQNIMQSQVWCQTSQALNIIVNIYQIKLDLNY